MNHLCREYTHPTERKEAPQGLVLLADYGGEYAGSFIPMVKAIAVAAASKRLPFTAAFSPRGLGKEWNAALAGYDLRFCEPTIRGVKALGAPQTGTLFHTHFSAFDVPALFALGAASRTQVIWHAHTALTHRGPIWSARYRLRYGVAARIVRDVICVSSDIQTQISGLGAPRTSLMPNAIDTSRFQPPTAGQRTIARTTLGLSTDQVVVVLFARDWKLKGVPVFLRAFSRLPSSAVALLVGATSNTAAEIVKQGLRNCIQVMPLVSDPRLYYYAVDLFVNASPAEGMPYSVLEAAACGVRLTVTDLPGQSSIAREIPGCTVAAVADADSLLEAMRDALSQPAPGHAGHHWVTKHASLDVWASRLLAHYSER